MRSIHLAQPSRLQKREERKAQVPRSAPHVSAPAWTFALSSRAATEAFGQAIGRTLKGGETLALFGELGAGKTALVRGIAVGLGTPPGVVSSPTFVLIHEYHGRLPLVHVDL